MDTCASDSNGSCPCGVGFVGRTDLQNEDQVIRRRFLDCSVLQSRKKGKQISPNQFPELSLSPNADPGRLTARGLRANLSGLLAWGFGSGSDSFLVHKNFNPPVFLSSLTCMVVVD